MKEFEQINFEQMKEIDIRTVERNSLVDIADIEIDENLPREARLANFIRQIKNPYCYRCGKAVVKVSFADTGVTLEDCLESYLKQF